MGLEGQTSSGYSPQYVASDRAEEEARARIRRISGQLDAVERSLDAEADCADVLQQVAAVRGAVTGLMGELLEEHLRQHVARDDLDGAERAKGVEELAGVLRRYWK